MKQAYRILAFLIAVAVMVQAAVMVWAVAGLGLWVDDGGVVDAQTFEAGFEGDAPFGEFLGFMIHGIVGMTVIPLLAIALLVVSFFAKIPQGVSFAATTLGLVALQIVLGVFGHSVSFLGALHGVNALVLFAVAAMAGVRVPRAVAGAAPA